LKAGHQSESVRRDSVDPGRSIPGSTSRAAACGRRRMPSRSRTGPASSSSPTGRTRRPRSRSSASTCLNAPTSTRPSKSRAGTRWPASASWR
jgi:hypothetical protein